METNRQVAIMMPVYNGEKTLPLAVASLIHQTYLHWKCYIVNDGSTDGTKAYLDSLEDERFVIIHFINNKGRPYARQAALDAAEGKYLAFLDADDFYHPEKLEKQVEAFAKNKSVYLVGCGMASFDNNLNLKIVRSDYNTEVLSFNIGKSPFKPARAASMVLLDKAKKIGYNLSLKYAQDTDFFMRLLDKNAYINISTVLYYYSEFESVTKHKILITNIYGIKLYSQYFRTHPFYTTKNIFFNLLKIGVKLFTYPFWSAEQFIDKRGKKVSNDLIEEFNNLILRFSSKP